MDPDNERDSQPVKYTGTDKEILTTNRQFISRILAEIKTHKFTLLRKAVSTPRTIIFLLTGEI